MLCPPHLISWRRHGSPLVYSTILSDSFPRLSLTSILGFLPMLGALLNGSFVSREAFYNLSNTTQYIKIIIVKWGMVSLYRQGKVITVKLA